MSDCLHLSYNYYGHKRCDLLTRKQDCDVCPFYCDSERFEYSHTEYKGVKCCYIKEKEPQEPLTIPDYLKRGQ